MKTASEAGSMNIMNVLMLIAVGFFIFIKSGAAANLCQRPDCAVSFKTLGCFKDWHLPHYIYNERDKTIANYGGKQIDWEEWENYLPGFISRCAEKAKELGCDLFGVQFFGECHAGSSSLHHYDRYGKRRCKDGIGTDFNDCNDRKFCAGKEFRNMVYKIVGECWSGPVYSLFFLEGHAHPKQCADQCFKDCACSTRFCAGKNFTISIYAITNPDIGEGGSRMSVAADILE